MTLLRRLACCCAALLLAGGLVGCGVSPEPEAEAPSNPEMPSSPEAAPAPQAESPAGALNAQSPREVADALEELWATFTADIDAASTSDDLLAAHPDTYEAIVAYGDDAMAWAFVRLRMGSATGVEAEALWRLLAELLGDELTLQAETDTAAPVTQQGFSSGGEAFNAWFVQAGKLLDEKGLDYLAVNAPKTYRLLTLR